jgi:aerobic carbon-monoxide dehydrogenase small subunit
VKVTFILNGEDVSVECEANDRLSDILREKFKLLELHVGCGFGRCGSCAVFLDGGATASCLVLAMSLDGREVVTLEGFRQTPEYLDIFEGMERARMETCGYCLSGKIIAIEDLLSRIPRPEDKDIREGLTNVTCKCTDYSSLRDAIMYAAEIRHERISRRGH